MSITQDAVAVFKNTLFNARPKPDFRGTDPHMDDMTSPPTAPNLLEQSLLAVARDSADIRRNHDSILNKASILNSLQDDLLEAFDRAYSALEQLAEARSQLAKAEAIAKFERDERNVAAQRLSSVTASYHQTVSELEKLRPEAKRLEGNLKQANERLASQESETTALAERLHESQGEIERVLAMEAATRRDQEAASAELASANAFIARKMTEIAQLSERFEMADQAARASNRALEDTRVEYASALVRLDEERVNLASAQSRISALETQLKDLGGKFSAARSGWSQESEKLNEQVTRLRDDLAQALGRDEAHQRLLSAAHNDLGALRLKTTELEAQLTEARHAAAQAIARAGVAETSRDGHARDVVSSKRLHQSLLRRVKPMIAALREKNAETQRLSTTLADLERRFFDYQNEASETIRLLQDHEAQLIADLETERARRVVAEGALAIDRSFRPSETQRRRIGEAQEGQRLLNAANEAARAPAQYAE